MKDNLLFLLFLLPLQIFVSFFLTLGISLFISKLLLIVVNLIHKPKEGIFKRKKSNKDYYFWSLRSVIKKWPIWLAGLFPSSFLINITLRVFGVKTSFSNNVNNANIDTEFIELGTNIITGKGCFIKSCMIFKKYLIIKKIKIEDGAIIGPYSFVSPGAFIKKNAVLNAFSFTKINQKIQEDSIYAGYPAQIIKDESLPLKSENGIKNILKKKANLKPLEEAQKHYQQEPETKFIIKNTLYIGIFIIIYFCSYSVPLFGFYLYFSEIFLPFVIEGYFAVALLLPYTFYLTILLTPLIFLGFHMVNIVITTVIIKLFYLLLSSINEPKEGNFHWDNKSKDFIYYFIRSFLLRYVKWKVQRSPYPWLIKPVFNFIGNCSIGKNTVIEDMYLGKEFIHIGDNAYLGKSVVANQLWGEELTVKRVEIRDNVVISDGCCIAPGSYIKENATILPLSITSKDEILSSDSFYCNAPIEQIQTQDQLDKILNINLNIASISKQEGE
jgi:acetyltransferase-like isoleucine patch superfamily enzyme